MGAITRYQASSSSSSSLVNRSQVSSDREKWDKIFTALVKLLKNQQHQLDTLVNERKILEDRIKMQYERWVSDTHLYQDRISQMKEELMGKEMERLLEASKSDFVCGLNQRKISFHRFKSEQAEDELADFREWFHYFSCNLNSNSQDTNQKNIKGRHSSSKPADSKVLEGEVKRLKLECDKLASEKIAEISALLKEKSFVWHQYNALECSLTQKLKSEDAEVEKVNENLGAVLAHLELLQSSNNEKDEMIGMLKTKIQEMEAGTNKLKEKICKLSQQIELLKKSKSDQATPALKHCKEENKISTQVFKSSCRDRSNVVFKTESSSVQVVDPPKDTQKGIRNSKRKAFCVGNIVETPKLFTSAFKVPKLKNSSTPKLFTPTPFT